MGNKEQYIPAAKYSILTDLFDPFMKYIMREEKFKNELLDEAKIQKRDTVLDFGCGTGTLSIMVKDKVMDTIVHGVDIDPKVLKIAKNKIDNKGLSIDLREFDGINLPYENNVFDKVISSLVFHHLVREQKVKMLKELYRVTKQGGEIHIADFGKPQNLTMRAGFFIIQLFDGFNNTKDNLIGSIPSFMEHVGYKNVKEVQQVMTILGTISIYSGTKL